MYYYAVAYGKIPGIYTSWNKAKIQIDGFKGAKYKKFLSKENAKIFIINNPNKQLSIETFLEPLEPLETLETEHTLIVFTDGSCRNNGKKNSVASFGTVWPFHPELDFGCKLCNNESHTNNRAEYHGVIYAIKQADILDPEIKKKLIIYTDSQLLINSLTIWLFKWKKNNWKKSDGEIISNLDLIKIMDEQMKRRNIIFHHVRAHTNENTWEAHFNDKVDKLAQINSLIQ